MAGLFGNSFGRFIDVVDGRLAGRHVFVFDGRCCCFDLHQYWRVRCGVLVMPTAAAAQCGSVGRVASVCGIQGRALSACLVGVGERLAEVDCASLLGGCAEMIAISISDLLNARAANW